LKTSRALLTSAEFNATLHICNPAQQAQMGMLKDSNNNYLNLPKNANDEVVRAGGLPILATTAMPSGKFLTGDFSRNGCEIREFTPLNIQFIGDDSGTATTNETLVVIQEEIIFPVYNPFWYIYGKFAAAKTELKTT